MELSSPCVWPTLPPGHDHMAPVGTSVSAFHIAKRIQFSNYFSAEL